MLLQSQGGEIQLLPALPKAWPDGHVKGLRARGGFEVEMTWKNGSLTEGRTESKIGGALRIRTAGKITVVSVGKSIEPSAAQSGLVEIPTAAGLKFIIRPA